MSYTIAVIGCGVIGQRLGHAFVENDQLELKYAVDVNREVLSAYCEEFGTQGYRDYKEVLRKSDLDIVYVAVPPKWHEEITLAALDARKHVICEKPIGISAEQGRRMAERAAEKRRVTAINFPFKYSPSFAKLRTMIADGELGEIQSIIIKIRMPRWPRVWQNVEWLTYRDQGGPLREIGSHFIYGVQELFGDIEVKQAEVEYTGLGRFEKEIQAQFVASGIPGRIDILTLEEDEEENTLYIRGSEGQLRFRGWYILERWEDGEWILVDNSTTNSGLELSKQMVAAIKGDGQLVSFDEATRVQAVIDAIFADV
ncbi:MAG: Gfo/Idh/MocA family protein [Candidatus Kariarchaeaceae archaeon]|jgi:predicted dehydrogenase